MPGERGVSTHLYPCPLEVPVYNVYSTIYPSLRFQLINFWEFSVVFALNIILLCSSAVLLITVYGFPGLNCYVVYNCSIHAVLDSGEGPTLDLCAKSYGRMHGEDASMGFPGM